jgi:hypothetical protein
VKPIQKIINFVMMKTKLFQGIFLGSLLWSSCSTPFKIADAGQIVPKEAQRVTRIDLKQLNGKLDKKLIRSSKIVEMLRKRSAKSDAGLTTQLLTDNQNSGIDFNQHAYWVQDNGQNHLYFLLKNPADFKKAIQKANSKIKLQKTNGVQYAGNDSTLLLAWKGNVAVFSIQSLGGQLPSIMDKLGKNLPENANSASKSAKIDPASLFTLSPERSVLTEPAFKKAMTGKHDMITYYKWGNMLQGRMGELFNNEQFKSVTTQLTDLNISGYSDFSNGRFMTHYDYMMSDSFRQQLREYVRPKVESDFSKYLYHPNNVVNLVISLNPKGVEKVMPQVENFLPMPDSAKGVFKEALKGMQGDVLLALRLDTAGLHPLLTIPIRDKAAVQQTLAMMVQTKKMTVDKGVYTLVPKVDALKNIFKDVEPPRGVDKSQEPQPQVPQPQELKTESSDVTAPTDSTETEDDTAMEMPLSPAKKKGPNLKMNQVMWDNDFLIFTDSLSVVALKQPVATTFTSIESTKALSSSSFGFHLNLNAAMESGYPMLAMVRMMVPELPLSDMRIVYNEKGAETVILSDKQSENILMTWFGFANQMSGFLENMLKDKPTESQEDDK